MDSSAEFSSFQDKITAALLQTTRAANTIASEDLDFHRNLNPKFAESLDEEKSRLLSLTSSLLKVAAAGTDIKAPVLEDADDVEDNWRGVVDVIDNLLEKADACLDEFTGIIKKLTPSQQDRTRKIEARSQESFPTIYGYGPSKLPKPQLLFHRAPDNSDTSSFRPLLKSKPNAIVPLEKSLQPVKAKGKPPFFSHPYETEIREAKYPKSAYVVAPPIEFGPVESTQAIWVDTPEAVADMISELEEAKEIAIDLEHHDVHSYHGLVSLMQISTRNKDWVVDTLQPWREDLQQLNRVFTNPEILKVLHGSTMDIVWLQRDLGLYVVGMFDTYHAAVALGFPKRSLKYLLEKFAKYEANKKYQMADWRLRPLTEEMLKYARADTHYLLYIYDCLRNELLEKSTTENNLIDYVLEHSKTEALQRYERPVYDAATGQGAGGWYDLLSRNAVLLSKEQFAVFKAAHQWRDEIARSEDEGVQCVFPKNALFRLATAMPLEKHTLFKTLSPVTLIVKNRVTELMEVIKTAKLAGATGPELRDIVKPKKFTFDSFASPTAAPPQTLSTAEPETVADIRADSSQFWGPALEQLEVATVPLEVNVAASSEALRLSLPIPPMPVTISEVQEKLGDAPSTATSNPSSAAPSLSKANKNEIFTVKEVAPRRKRKISEEPEPALSESTSSSGESNSSYEDSSLDSDPSDVEHQPAKKSRKTAKQATTNSQKKEDNSTPFDYSTAPSVLHSKNITTDSTSTKKPFNPYQKALNAPRGMRKTKKEISGRTFTFSK
ncbi:putative exosome complex exonuclease Rrp6 [Talaromyces proteolyticus]|uniref:Exosome complex exonuclease Rrp6 n=1 Tax=Talaromyces proteolyticus TaxID=1131652 RepID=A0AAD4KTZ7_9EURO|nr:putative exosome complex exonuclease Rrp6 [Talaromyces proteolyticus]KAH8697060.1 putative exosome complex exonuclease Rrp6 [Talaromyces proteolyticus]